jgi:hypothetical protein
MIKRCWLHIGMHKTGSSSVQHNLAAVKDPDGWSILRVGGRANMGPALHAILNQPHDESRWFRRLGYASDQVSAKGEVWAAEFREAVASSDKELFIVSAEAISTFTETAVVELKKFLDSVFDEVRVIGYVRSPKAFKVSRFQENVKHGNGRFNVGSMKMDYRRLFEKFDRIFGRENVNLRKFDPSRFTANCAVTDFCEQIGISLPPDFQIQRFNESLSREACGILFAYRKFGPGYGVGENVIKENVKLLKALRSMTGAKFDIADSVFESTSKRERKDREWMQERLSESLVEKARENADAIRNEEEMLTITKASCEDFAGCFQRLYGKTLSVDLGHTADPVDPAKVAELVHSARLLLITPVKTSKTPRTPWEKVRRAGARARKFFLRLPGRVSSRR